MPVQRRAIAAISMLVAVIGIAACGTSEASSGSPTPDASPTATPTSVSPTPTWADPYLNVFGQYPEDGADGISTRATLQFRLYKELPVMRVSLSPDIPLEQVDFDRGERALRYVDGKFVSSDSVGEMFIFRPESPLEPGVTYEVTLEFGYEDAETVKRTWQFTTDSEPEPDYASQVNLPTLPSIGEGGDGALLVGEMIVDGPCVFIGEERNTMPLFEEGTVWWEGDTLFFRGNRYEVGDSVPLGGGEVKDISGFTFVQEPHDSCSYETAWSNIR